MQARKKLPGPAALAVTFDWRSRRRRGGTGRPTLAGGRLETGRTTSGITGTRGVRITGSGLARRPGDVEHCAAMVAHTGLDSGPSSKARGSPRRRETGNARWQIPAPDSKCVRRL